MLREYEDIENEVKILISQYRQIYSLKSVLLIFIVSLFLDLHQIMMIITLLFSFLLIQLPFKLI